MGRTTQTMTQLVAQEEAYWAPFRRALRKEDQQIFDRLFAAARHHSAPAHYASHATPFDAMLLAMLLEAMKVVDALRQRLELLEQGQAASAPPPPEGPANGRCTLSGEDLPALPAGRAGGA